MAEEIEFVDGLIVKAPRDNAPDYVKASISIKVEDLGKWLREKYKAKQEWVNIDVKVSKAGKWYCAVNTFKPKEKASAKPGYNPVSELDSDIPFAPIGKLEASVR